MSKEYGIDRTPKGADSYVGRLLENMLDRVTLIDPRMGEKLYRELKRE